MTKPQEHKCINCRRPYTLTEDFLLQLRQEWAELHKKKKDNDAHMSFTPQEEDILRNIERILADEEKPRYRRAMWEGGIDLSKREYGVELDFLESLDKEEYPVLYSRLAKERRRWGECLRLFRPQGLDDRTIVEQWGREA